MTKSYLNYKHISKYGIIASSYGNIQYSNTPQYALVPAMNQVYRWNLKTHEYTVLGCDEDNDNDDNNDMIQVSCIRRFNPTTTNTSTTPSTTNSNTSDNELIAIGYSSGIIKLYSNNHIKTELHGHHSQITCLQFSHSGQYLISGSKDTNMILWDLAEERGVWKMIGHKDEITQVVLLYHTDTGSTTYTTNTNTTNTNTNDSSSMDEPIYLISSSKDTLIKIWNLQLKQCIDTIIGHRSEIWDICLLSPSLLVSGSSERDLKVWMVDYEVMDIRSGYSSVSATSTAGTPTGTTNTSTNNATANETNNEETEEAVEKQSLTLIQTIPKQSPQRIVQIQKHNTLPYVVCQTADRTLEVFRYRTDEEVLRKHERLRRRNKKIKQTGDGTGAESKEVGADKETGGTGELGEVKRLVSLRILKTTSKIVSFDISPSPTTSASPTPNTNKENAMNLLIHLNNNTIEEYTLDFSPRIPSTTDSAFILKTRIDYGHQSEIKHLVLSSSNELVLSLSRECIKLSNLRTGRIIRTFSTSTGSDSSESGVSGGVGSGGKYHPTCALIVRGDRYIIVGTKSGELLLYDLYSGDLLEIIQAHSNSVWDMKECPDGLGFMSGGSDKCVRFWEYTLSDYNTGTTTDTTNSTTNTGRGVKRLSIIHTRTLEMQDEILCLTYSPNSKLIAVGLLNSSIQLFHSDTLKHYLSLYGHALPVTCLDISSDNEILVSGGVDKKVKIWGLGFGDCHRSLVAHTESVVGVGFIGRSHYFFSIGRESGNTTTTGGGGVKYWDGDTYSLIKSYKCHGIQYALDISKDGLVVAVGGSERCVNVLERSQEPVFLEEERERERDLEYERMYESNAASAGGATKEGVEGEEQEEEDSGRIGKLTFKTLITTEHLTEALSIHHEYISHLHHYYTQLQQGIALPKPSLNPIVEALGYGCTADYVLSVVERVRGWMFESVIQGLGYDSGMILMGVIYEYLSGRNKGGRVGGLDSGSSTEGAGSAGSGTMRSNNDSRVKLCMDVFWILIRVHYKQFLSNTTTVPVTPYTTTNTSSTPSTTTSTPSLTSPNSNTPNSSTTMGDVITEIPMKVLIEELRDILRTKMYEEKDRVGTNLSALGFIKRMVRMRRSEGWIEEGI